MTAYINFLAYIFFIDQNWGVTLEIWLSNLQVILFYYFVIGTLLLINVRTFTDKFQPQNNINLAKTLEKCVNIAVIIFIIL